MLETGDIPAAASGGNQALTWVLIVADIGVWAAASVMLAGYGF